MRDRRTLILVAIIILAIALLVGYFLGQQAETHPVGRNDPHRGGRPGRPGGHRPQQPGPGDDHRGGDGRGPACGPKTSCRPSISRT
jgi:hypothetical protein